MKLSSFISFPNMRLPLILLLLLLCHTADIGDAALQPAVALFDSEHTQIMSATELRDIDFGLRSSIGNGKRPAKVFALQTTIGVSGNMKTVADTRGARDLYLIPYCSLHSNTASTGNINSCSLDDYEGYVLLRFRGGWEGVFAASLWRDSTMHPNVVNAVHFFKAIANDSTLTFPFDLERSSASSKISTALSRRYELSENCGDFTDECFQGRYMTYTTSFKEIPLDRFTGRMIFHVGVEGGWNGPWTLRLQSTMLHDSSTYVDIVMVLVNKNGPLKWYLWLSSTFLGNVLMVAFCLMWVVGFIVGVKELGMRNSVFVPLNERNVTVLYEDINDDENQCIFLYRIMLATQEIFIKILKQLFLLQCTIWNRLQCCSTWRWRRRRWMQNFVQSNTDDVLVENANNETGSREMEMESVAVNPSSMSNSSGQNNNNNNDQIPTEEGTQQKEDRGEGRNDNDDYNDDDDDDSELLCRICQCSKPVEELFAPCSCDGSSKYVHRSCLEKWRAMTSNEEHKVVCAECKTPYVLMLERVPVSPDEFLHSPICVPACRAFASRVAILLLFVLQLWVGGYYLKFCMYIVTGFDDGVIWSAAHLYHWILGLYYIVAFCLNMHALEYVLRDFSESWQQMLILILSLGVIEIPLSYLGQIVLSWMLNRTWSFEVSYGVGIVVTAILYVEVLPHLYEHLQSLLKIRVVVAPRAESARNREIL
ncbi:zinc finger protein [Trypanosoma melophagium]|uniref:zinc finger protein n=1 Tax=Trypanosoma melophagium TaxID=715481 RepID=UPI00351AAB96|nr:zinc finger protein [Trypanosoma melophagium]